MPDFDFNDSAMDLTIYKLRDTLLTLISDVTEKQDNNDIEIPEEVTALKTKLYNLISQLDDEFDKPLEQRHDFIKSALSLQDEILKLADAANTYTMCVQQMGDYVLDKVKHKDVATMPDSFVNNSVDVVAEIGKFLDSISDEEQLSSAKSLLISAVPMRMPRASFNDLVQSSLESNFEGLSLNFIEHSINQMKSFMCGIKTDTYGKYFKNITDRINDVYALNMDKLTTEDLNDYLDDADYCISILSNAFRLLSIYYSDVNYILILASYVVDGDFLFEDNFVMKDLYYGMLDYIGEKADEVPVETIYENTIDLIEEMYSEYKPKEKQLKYHISKLTVDEIEALDDSLKTILNTFLVVERLYGKMLDYALMGSYDNIPDEPATESELKDACRKIVEKINAVISGLPIKEQKYRKQNFLSRIPCIYKKEDLLAYIAYSLEGITDNKNKWVVYGNIFEIFDKFGFKSDDKK